MYNEENVASKCVDAVMHVINNLSIPASLIVVNDGSTDTTGDILTKKLKKYKKNYIVVKHKENKGFGGATQSGIQKSLALGFTWCLHMDSDLTNNPRLIRVFVKNMADDYDCIKASRYIKGGKVVNVPQYRQVISFVGNYIAAAVLHIGIKDVTNGFRMVRVEKLKGITFKENNFSIILEELYFLKKRHAKFKEIPYTLTARTNSQSHFTYKPKIFYDYFKYVIKSLT